MSELVTIHQPEHLPWLGFFAKMDRADLFISLDNVQFRKRYFQNRNRVLGFDGEPMWLTVPVRTTDHRDREIRQVEIADDGRWRKKYLRTLQHRYGGRPYFDAFYPPIAEVIGRDWTRIADLNHALIEVLREPLGVDTPIVRASELGGDGKRSTLLADLSERTDAETYLSGPSGRDYLRMAPFRAAGIGVAFHDYEHPTYPQTGTDDFVSHLSVVDLLFEHGPDRARDAMRSGSRIEYAESEAPASG